MNSKVHVREPFGSRKSTPAANLAAKAYELRRRPPLIMILINDEFMESVCGEDEEG
jgi:hypothetical protein